MTCLPEFRIDAFVKVIFAAQKQTEENPLPTAPGKRVRLREAP
jgi:hypothetical protein